MFAIVHDDVGNHDVITQMCDDRRYRIDYGVAAWGGLCPPPGDKPHRYVFTVYALKTDKLELPPDATPALAGFMTQANKIAQASFTAKYGRPAAKK